MRPCAACGGPLPAGCQAHRTYCDRCLTARHRAYCRERYRARRAAGQCGDCGAPSPGRHLCPVCVQARVQRERTQAAADHSPRHAAHIDAAYQRALRDARARLHLDAWAQRTEYGAEMERLAPE